MNKLTIQQKSAQIISRVCNNIPCILEIPPQKDMGDFSSNIAMKSAKIFKKSPLVIGEEIKQALLKDKEAKKNFEKIEVVNPGFLNFFIQKKVYLADIKNILDKGKDYGRSKHGKGHKVNIEFVSANPTGPLHVGHGRGAVLGDALANLYDFAGYKVTREYYLNDCGRQMNILGKTTKAWIHALDNGETPNFNGGQEGEWYKGDYMKDVAIAVKEKHGKDLDIKEFGYFAGQEILEGIKYDLRAFGVGEFEVWSSETDLHKKGDVDKALAVLRKKGFIEDKDGAVWFKSSMFGDEKDRVVKRSNGELTYLAADIAYHWDKLERGFDKLVDIWGADHHGYVPRLKGAVQALGYEKEKLHIILCQLVTLMRGNEPVQMSTRSGEFITLKEVVDEVGKDAARFFFLMRKSDAKLDFDLELAKKHSMDNPVYYVEYAHARICSIFKRLKEEHPDIKYDSKKCNLDLLCEDEELESIKDMVRFQDVIEGASQNDEPHRLTNYLQELAGNFHRFYSKHRVITDDLELSKARLFLIDSMRVVLSNGLGLLGIEGMESM